VQQETEISSMLKKTETTSLRQVTGTSSFAAETEIPPVLKKSETLDNTEGDG
jgi:hypothetical protein